MGESIKIATIMTLVAIVFKLLLINILSDEDQIRMYNVFAHLFIILTGTYFGIRQFKSLKRNSGVKEDIMAGMRIAGLYAIFITLFIVIYYSFIDQDYFARTIEERMAIAREYNETHPEYDLENARKGLEFTFNLKIYAAFTTFALLLSGAIYSIILALLVKKLKIWKV